MFRILWYKVAFILVSVTANFPGPVSEKQAQIIIHPPPCLALLYHLYCICCDALCLVFDKCGAVMVLMMSGLIVYFFLVSESWFNFCEKQNPKQTNRKAHVLKSVVYFCCHMWLFVYKSW